jgi:hypothetical protein
MFFVGDGLTGTGSGDTQIFHVPDTATRLFLGFSDRHASTPDLPGWYGDNSGSITLTVEQSDDLTGIEENTHPILGIRLLQNYPNPFNPTTMIRFDLPRAGHVNLSVYSVKGELIATLVNKRMLEGRKEIAWTAKDTRGQAVSSGVYFYLLVAGDFVETRKMVLLR